MKPLVTLTAAGLLAATLTVAAGPPGSDGTPTTSAAPMTISRPPAPHVDWDRSRTPRELLAASRSVVRAEVTAIEPAPPIRAEDAGARPGSPDVPRQLVTLRKTEQVFGIDTGERFYMVHFIPPGGVHPDEDPGYRVGERLLLFLRPAAMPGPWQPKAWQRVSIDGRVQIAADGQLEGALPDGPAAALNRGRGDLKRLLREVAG